MNYMAMPGTKYGGFIPDGQKFSQTEYITSVICNKFKIPFKQVCGDFKGGEVVRVRQICMYFLYKVGGLTYVEIGKLFHKDHTTIIHSVRRVTEERKVYPLIDDELTLLTNLIYETQQQ